MSQFTKCDGCGKEVSPSTIHGKRNDGWQGARPLPDGEFDWCKDCAIAAFAWVNITSVMRNTIKNISDQWTDLSKNPEFVKYMEQYKKNMKNVSSIQAKHDH